MPNKLIPCLLVAWALTAAHAARGAEIVMVNVAKQGAEYAIDFEVNIEALPEQVLRVLTDYPNLADLSPSVVRSDVVSGHAGSAARVAVTLRPCVLVFLCRQLRKVTDASVALDSVTHVTVGELSDFSAARETVTVAPRDGGTRVVYVGTLSPKFFIPPVLGTWLIRSEILSDLETTVQRVEERARAHG